MGNKSDSSRMTIGANGDLEVTVRQVAENLDSPAIQLVDCREQEEWDAGHIDDSHFLPLGEFERRLDEFDRDKQIIVVCRSGNRSHTAAKFLVASGFDDAKSMAGGLIDWVEQGNDIVS